MVTRSTTTRGIVKSRVFCLAILNEGAVGIGGIQSSIGRDAGRLGDPNELLSLLRALVDLLCDLDTRLTSWLLGRFGKCLLCTVIIVGIHVA